MDVDYLKKCGKIVTFKNGEAICHEGETGHSMYVLLKGMVEITIDSFSDMPKSLGLVSEGSFFGEMSLLEKKPRSATIISRSDDCIALEVSEDDFSMLLLHATSITFRLLLSLNSRLNDMLDRIELNDKKYVFKYKRNPLYGTIQKMDVRTFDQIAKKDADYVWELLKYLSSSLEKLNREYINQSKDQ